jgi:hypothetical protein
MASRCRHAAADFRFQFAASRQLFSTISRYCQSMIPPFTPTYAAYYGHIFAAAADAAACFASHAIDFRRRHAPPRLRCR